LKIPVYEHSVGLKDMPLNVLPNWACEWQNRSKSQPRLYLGTFWA